MVVVPICLSGRCCSSGVWVLNRINKDEDNESLPLLAFRRNIVKAIFLKYTKEGRLCSCHVGILKIPSDVFYDNTKHYQVQSDHRRIQNPFKHLIWSVFPKQLTAYAKTLHLRCLNTPLLKNKAGVRCAKKSRYLKV